MFHHSGFDANSTHNTQEAEGPTRHYVTGSAFERLLPPFPVRRAHAERIISVYVFALCKI